MSNESKPKKVFISYSYSERPKLDSILESLRSHGLVEAQDQIISQDDLPQGHRSLRESVKRAIQSASAVVVVWGNTSAQSQWVNYEIGLADAFGKPIIIVTTKAEVGKLPAELQDVQILEFPGDG